MKKLRAYITSIDIILLVFLILFTNQAVITLKILGLIFVYAVRPNFKFGLFKGRMPFFYVAIILLSIINLVVHVQEYTSTYLLVLLVGNLFWIFCLLAFHQVKLSVERNSEEKIRNTLKLFTILNLVLCLYYLIKIMIITGTIDPFSPKLDYPYGISTGDKIFGIFLESSYYNIMVSSMLCIYFMYRKDILYVFISLICLLLSFGNMGTMLFLVTLLILFILSVVRLFIKSEKLNTFVVWYSQITVDKKRILFIPGIFLFVIAFYLILSPENFKYTVGKIQMRLTSSEQTDINLRYSDEAKYIKDPTRDHKHSNDTVSISNAQRWEKELMTRDYLWAFQGKKLSFRETFTYIQSSPMAMLFGADIGRFSSLTAIRFGHMDSSRLFSKVLPYYNCPLYGRNHKLIHLIRMQLEPVYFATMNWPDSFYNQILGEYGLLGLLVFIIFYVGYFVKRVRNWSYALWLCMLVVTFSYISYMFEALCVMVFFELLMELDISDNKNVKQVT